MNMLNFQCTNLGQESSIPKIYVLSWKCYTAGPSSKIVWVTDSAIVPLRKQRIKPLMLKPIFLSQLSVSQLVGVLFMVLLIGTCCGEEFPHSRSFFSRGRRNIPAVIVTVINYLHVSFSVDGKKPKQTLLFSIQMFLFKFDVSTCYFKVDATNNDKSRLHLVFTRISKDRKHNSLSCRGFEIHIDQPFIFGLINNIEFLGRAVLSRKD